MENNNSNLNCEVTDIDASLDTKLDDMVKTKSYKDLEELIVPNYPINIFINGETGLGKSTAVLHIAKGLKKPVVKINMSYATDVDDIIGGLRLEDGSTKIHLGPVPLAMQMGAILLLDEVDHGNPRILMELQPVLEGRGLLIKKLNKMIYPAEGFQVIATGNTKGQGDRTGKYIGANILNKAFLDRFTTNIEFIPPNRFEMEKILIADVKGLNQRLANGLARWYEQILDAAKNGVSVESISTRKMVDIAKLFMVFDVQQLHAADAKKSIRLGTNILDEEVGAAFINLWDQMTDEHYDHEIGIDDEVVTDEDGDKIPF